MRITGSLFTFAEMSASIKDGTFQSQSGAVLLTTNACVTVDDAANTVKILPITGLVNRYPAYHELRPSGSGGVSNDAYITYYFDRYNGSTDGYAIITKRSIADGSYTTIAYLNVDHTSAAVTVDATLYTLYVSLYAVNDFYIDCTITSGPTIIDTNSANQYNSIIMGPESLSSGLSYDVVISTYGTL